MDFQSEVGGRQSQLLCNFILITHPNALPVNLGVFEMDEKARFPLGYFLMSRSIVFSIDSAKEHRHVQSVTRYTE